MQWLRRSFIAGFFVTVPLFVSVAAFIWLAGVVDDLTGPFYRFMLGVDRDQALPTDPGELTRMVADLQLFAVHAQDTAMRILVSAAAQPECPALSPRELEVLRWTMDGKTAKAIGALLNITERTAVQHLQNAMVKLNVNSKHVAVLKALRLGLIH